MISSAQSTIVFADPNNPVLPSTPIIHDNDSFRVQWAARNTDQAPSPAFVDLLVITSIAGGCPGSDDEDHPVVFRSDTDGQAADFQEQSLAPGEAGGLMQPTVGPFPAGSYRLTVTLASDAGGGATTFNCIDIVPAV